ncbi:class I SAM-dependent methyltransferase [Jatrophihabitans cynanchi]|uniref:Class I SAM-dependent methyltransferase n=1 Tax=Jatrophihabitans cynanchi TaxID=2944128 RepID=A0ABY7JTY3_9ACTN|nr:class I SAM-dependent methyltransferase [Jatrophihabitans sp. SB3-54]WAX56019.1 class I SAM-dependent methyltransferase [Jatrophihabitans sp. SB3-54]
MSPIDRLGVWLSGHRIRRTVGDLARQDVADFGCGFEAAFMRTVVSSVRSATLVDLALAEDLKAHPKITAIEGVLPEALEAITDASFDVILCMSVLEHLWDPQQALSEFRRLLRPGGVCAVNVPSWRGKRALEFSAFRLGLSPAAEMDDHKAYYDPSDLWPLLVRAGFLPHNIKCFRHKLTLNTFAICRN